MPRWRSFHRLYVIHKIAYFICELLMLAHVCTSLELETAAAPGSGQIYAVSYKYIKICTPLSVHFKMARCRSINLVVSNQKYFLDLKSRKGYQSPPVLFVVAPLCYLIFFRRNCHFEVKVRFYSNTGI